MANLLLTEHTRLVWSRLDLLYYNTPDLRAGVVSTAAAAAATVGQSVTGYFLHLRSSAKSRADKTSHTEFLFWELV